MSKQIKLFFIELFAVRSVLLRLIAQQLVLRYRRTTLGFLWTLINPLVMMLVVAIVFSALFKADFKSFAVSLFAALIPWNFFNAVVIQSAPALIYNEGLIKKIYLPKAIFPLSIALALLLDSVLSFFIFFVMFLVYDGRLSWALLSLPFSFILLFLFAIGIGFILAIATVFFRDLPHVTLIVMQSLFFLTPIIYKPDSLGDKFSILIALNPVAPFIALFRAPIVDGIWPLAEIFIQSFSIATVTLGIGLFVFLRYEKKIIFRL